VTVYVPKDRVAELRGWVLEHKRVKVLLREIPELGLAETARVIAGAPRQAKCCGRLLAGEGGLEPEPEAAGAVLAPGAPTPQSSGLTTCRSLSLAALPLSFRM